MTKTFGALFLALALFSTGCSHPKPAGILDMRRLADLVQESPKALKTKTDISATFVYEGVHYDIFYQEGIKVYNLRIWYRPEKDKYTAPVAIIVDDGLDGIVDSAYFMCVSCGHGDYEDMVYERALPWTQESKDNGKFWQDQLALVVEALKHFNK